MWRPALALESAHPVCGLLSLFSCSFPSLNKADAGNKGLVGGGCGVQLSLCATLQTSLAGKAFGGPLMDKDRVWLVFACDFETR